MGVEKPSEEGQGKGEDKRGEGNEPGEEKDEKINSNSGDETARTEDGGHTDGGGDPFASLEFKPGGEDVTGYRTQTNQRREKSERTGKSHWQESFGNVQDEHRKCPFPAQHPINIGKADVARACFSNVNPVDEAGEMAKGN